MFQKSANILLAKRGFFMYNIYSSVVKNIIVWQTLRYLLTGLPYNLHYFKNKEFYMIVNGPQNTYNSLPSLDTQNQPIKPEVKRTPQEGTAIQGEKSGNGNLEQKALHAPDEQVDVSLQQVKGLSNIFNTYRSYVNQLDATDRLVNRVANGVAGVNDLLGS
jgi:hypothetical protein